MTGVITGTPKVDMLLGVSRKKAGRSVESLIASRHVLDVDEASAFYSTDFPTGGTESRDFNGTRPWRSRRPTRPTPTGTTCSRRGPTGTSRRVARKNTVDSRLPGASTPATAASASGLNPDSTDLGAQVVANWGEDKNFNNVLDPGEDREPAPFGNGGMLDASWNTTRRLRLADPGRRPHRRHLAHRRHRTSRRCPAARSASWWTSSSGPNGVLGQWEMLVTPVVQKVNPGLDADGDPTHRLEITNWAWNMEIDLATSSISCSGSWTPTRQSITRADLFNDQTILNFLGGAQGALAGGNSPLTNGFQVFAPFNGTASVNGTAGNNRVGKNACIFENAGPPAVSPTSPSASRSPRTAPTALGQRIGLGDADDDGDTLIDEFVTANGPIRNFDITQVERTRPAVRHPGRPLRRRRQLLPGRAGLLGPGRHPHQPQAGYGVGVDDMVIEWREVALAKDVTELRRPARAPR